MAPKWLPNLLTHVEKHPCGLIRLSGSQWGQLAESRKGPTEFTTARAHAQFEKFRIGTLVLVFGTEGEGQDALDEVLAQGGENLLAEQERPQSSPPAQSGSGQERQAQCQGGAGDVAVREALIHAANQVTEQPRWDQSGSSGGQVQPGADQQGATMGASQFAGSSAYGGSVCDR